MGRPAKHEVQEFEGVRYYKKGEGYYKACYKKSGNTTRYMHREVWSASHGEIPIGYCIHHKDHDRSNNTIQNLEIMSSREHAIYHINKRIDSDPDAHRDNFFANTLPAAVAWHKSGTKEVQECHRKIGFKSWEGRENIEYTCILCGAKYEALRGTKKKGFCSPACQSEARRRSGVDDIEARCLICGKKFIKNKYARVKTCSRECGRVLRRKTLKARASK